MAEEKIEPPKPSVGTVVGLSALSGLPTKKFINKISPILDQARLVAEQNHSPFLAVAKLIFCKLYERLNVGPDWDVFMLATDLFQIEHEHESPPTLQARQKLNKKSRKLAEEMWEQVYKMNDEFDFSMLARPDAGLSRALRTVVDREQFLHVLLFRDIADYMLSFDEEDRRNLIKPPNPITMIEYHLSKWMHLLVNKAKADVETATQYFKKQIDKAKQITLEEVLAEIPEKYPGLALLLKIIDTLSAKKQCIPWLPQIAVCYVVPLPPKVTSAVVNYVCTPRPTWTRAIPELQNLALLHLYYANVQKFEVSDQGIAVMWTLANMAWQDCQSTDRDIPDLPRSRPVYSSIFGDFFNPSRLAGLEESEKRKVAAAKKTKVASRKHKKREEEEDVEMEEKEEATTSTVTLTHEWLSTFHKEKTEEGEANELVRTVLAVLWSLSEDRPAVPQALAQTWLALSKHKTISEEDLSLLGDIQIVARRTQHDTEALPHFENMTLLGFWKIVDDALKEVSKLRLKNPGAAGAKKLQASVEIACSKAYEAARPQIFSGFSAAQVSLYSKERWDFSGESKQIHAFVPQHGLNRAELIDLDLFMHRYPFVPLVRRGERELALRTAEYFNTRPADIEALLTDEVPWIEAADFKAPVTETELIWLQLRFLSLYGCCFSDDLGSSLANVLGIFMGKLRDSRSKEKIGRLEDFSDGELAYIKRELAVMLLLQTSSFVKFVLPGRERCVEKWSKAWINFWNLFDQTISHRPSRSETWTSLLERIRFLGSAFAYRVLIGNDDPYLIPIGIAELTLAICRAYPRVADLLADTPRGRI